MNAFQVRSFIEQILSAPNVFMAQAMVDTNLNLLDATFFQVLQAMIQEAENQGQFGSSLFSPNMPGVVADFVIDHRNQADQRVQGLRMLYQYAATRQQPAGTGAQANSPSTQPAQLYVTCSGCGNQYPVMCPGFGMHMPGPTVVESQQGGSCTICGAPITFVTCVCGAVTNLAQPQPIQPAQQYRNAPGPNDEPGASYSAPPSDDSYSGQSSAGGDSIEDLFASLQNEFAKEKNSGNMDEARQQGLESVLDAVKNLVDNDQPGRSLEDMNLDRGKLDSLMAGMLTRIKNPTLAGPQLPHGSRAEKVFTLLQDRKAFVGAESMKQQKADGETTVSMDLFVRLGRLTTFVHRTEGDEGKLLALETDQARQLMNEVRQFARRSYITLAQPAFSRGNIQPDPNSIFFSGPSPMRESLEGAAGKFSLTVNPATRRGVEFDESRWRDLRAASLGVFDVSAKSPQVYYELGMALVLGLELLIIADQNTEIPFDVAQEPHRYSASEDFEDFFSSELDAVVYGLQSTGSDGSSLADTVARAERLATLAGNSGLTRVALDSLRKVASDPVAVAPALSLLNTFLKDRAQLIFYPRWPGRYPDPAAPRCFIVMPFDLKLDPAYRLIEQLCSTTSVTPIRGDRADEGEIIKSIWEEIGRATHITVDLTDFNLNVCLELGIADALGRNTILIGREGTDRKLKEMLPNMAKRRCHTYPVDPAQKPQFVMELGRFLSANET